MERDDFQGHKLNVIQIAKHQRKLFCILCFFFQMWQFAPNSLHYLLSLWQRMVASMPYVKNTEPHLLVTYAPEVLSSHLTVYSFQSTVVKGGCLQMVWFIFVFSLLVYCQVTKAYVTSRMASVEVVIR